MRRRKYGRCGKMQRSPKILAESSNQNRVVVKAGKGKGKALHGILGWIRDIERCEIKRKLLGKETEGKKERAKRCHSVVRT